MAELDIITASHRRQFRRGYLSLGIRLRLSQRERHAITQGRMTRLQLAQVDLPWPLPLGLGAIWHPRILRVAHLIGPAPLRFWPFADMAQIETTVAAIRQQMKPFDRQLALALDIKRPGAVAEPRRFSRARAQA